MEGNFMNRNGIEGGQTPNGAKKYYKYFLFYGLFNAAIALMWGAYNNYFPIILQAGNPNFDTHGMTGLYGFGLSAFATGVVMSIDNFIINLCGPVFGAMADKSLRRKKLAALFGVIVATSIVLITVCAGFANAENNGDLDKLWPALAGIVVAIFFLVIGDSIGASYRAGINFSMVPKNHYAKMSSFAVLFGGVGFVVATMTSSILYNFNKNYPFFLAAGVMFIVAALFYIVIDSDNSINKQLNLSVEVDSSGKRIKSNPFRTLADLFKSLDKNIKWTILLIIVLSTCNKFGVMGLQTFGSSWMLNELGIQPNIAMLITVMFFLGLIVPTIPIGYIADKVNKQKLFAIALVILLLGGILLPMVGKNLILLGTICFVLGVGTSIFDVITIPYTMSLMPEGLNRASTIYSTTLAIMSITSAIVVPFLGFVIDAAGNYNALFYSMSIAAAIGFIPLQMIIRIDRKKLHRH
jgi:MFS family permease